jgi:hypothetical protein
MFAEGRDAADHFMPRHPRRLQRRIGTFDVRDVRSTNAAGLDLDQHFANARCWYYSFYQLEGAWLGYLHCAVCAFHGQLFRISG